jgi:tape measure domain-containing protein
MSDALRYEFQGDASNFNRTIKEVKKEIKETTKAFEGAEIGAKDFTDAASNLSGLQKELKDARSAVADIDGAYKKLSQTMAQFRSGMGARGAIPSVASPVRGTAQQFGSPEYFDALNRNLERAINEGRQLDAEIAQAANSRQQAIANFRAGMGAKGASWVASSVQGTPEQFGSPAYFDSLNKDLKRAIDEGRQLDAEIKSAAESREQAIMQFRSGMGAKGAIPAIASPIRGGMEYGPAYGSAGSPAYLEEVAKAAKKAQQELDDAAKAAGTIAPQPKAFNPASLAAFETKLKLLKKEARLIAPDSTKWKALTKEILQVERSIEKINKRQRLGPSAGQRAGAAGGAFLYGGGMGGGIGSAFGGVVGGAIGGVPGAFTGAAVGQIADNLGTALAGITSQAAAVQKMQRGLAMASVDAKDFAAAQAAVGEMSQKLLMPLEQTTKYFAQLRANTKEYNLSVAETRQILEGTALAIMATGGSAEDLDGAMRAVVQIMSKGGVQAEELRGQLGERFPGAVVKFAQANKLSFEELQSRLEDGTVGIREFIEFAKKNYTDYAKFSEQLATAPEYAGQRLKIALEQLSLEVGSLFGSMGAGIQDALTSAINGISKFVKDNRVYIRQFISDFGSIVGPIAKIFVQLLGVVAKFSVEVGKVFQGLYSNIRQALGMASIGEAKARLDRAEAATKGRTRPKGNTRGGGDGGFTELDQARKAFKDLGGQAAFDKANAPTQPTNLTFGGPGAGMSIDRTGKGEKDEKEKNQKLQEFTNDRIKILKQRQEAENLNVDNQLLVSDREKELAKAAIDFRYGNLIIDEQLAQAEKDSLQYRVEDRGRFLAEMQTLADIERGAVKTKQQIAVAGPLMSEYQRLIDTQDELKLSLESVLSGQDELTESQKVAVLISKVLKGATAKQVAEVDKLTKAAIAAAAAVDKGRAVLAGATAIKELQDQIKLLGIISDDERRLAELRELYKNDEAIVQQVFNLEKIKEDIEKARALISDFVSSTASDYKGFLKAAISGEDAVDALKQFQAGLKDKVLTIFLDFTMAPVEKFFKESLLGFLNPKVDPKLLEQEKSVNALTANTTELKNLTTAIKGMGAGTNATSSIQDPTAGNAFSDGSALPPIAPGFDAASVFSNPEALTGAFGGVQASISESMNGIVSSFENGASSLGNALPAWDTALATNIPDTLKTSTNETNKAAPTFQESLGKVTAGIGIAAGAIMGIAAGISQIKEGGTSNVLGGIGSVLMSLGGAVGGFAGLLKGANGGVAGGGWKPFPVRAFANGGMVNGPTLGLVGEGKYNEAIVPLPDGRSIPVQMKGGGGGLREAMSGSNGRASGSPILNMSFQSTNINGVEYVSRDQLEAAMAQTRKQASRDGANRGMSMTLDKLQQSPQTRNRLGMR